MEAETPVKEIHFVINIGCSDAREGGPLYSAVKDIIIEKYREQGIAIDYSRISSAGTFITRDIKEEVNVAIHKKIYYAGQKYGDALYFGEVTKGEREAGMIPLRIFINISTHGDARLVTDATGNLFSPTEITINPNSPYNCGMLGAAGVWEEMIREMQGSKALQFSYFDHERGEKVSFPIDSLDALKVMLSKYYGYNGVVANDFVRSIDDLKLHAVRQKQILREAIEKNPHLSHLIIHITAAVNNYPEYRYFRVDENNHVTGVLDHIYLAIRRVIEGGVIPADSPYIVKKGEKQNPVVGVMQAPDIPGAKALAIKTAIDRGYVKDVTEYQAGQVFSVSGVGLARPYSPFDPYQLAGTYYSIRHLGIGTYFAIGRDATEASMIVRKIRSDPIMGFFMDKYNVNIVPLSAGDFKEKPYQMDAETKGKLKEFLTHFKPVSSELRVPKQQRLKV
ncbi:MAG: hypothetical protein V1492_03215 [Candidatus Micrarchaeota archaeon]